MTKDEYMKQVENQWGNLTPESQLDLTASDVAALGERLKEYLANRPNFEMSLDMSLEAGDD